MYLRCFQFCTYHYLLLSSGKNEEKITTLITPAFLREKKFTKLYEKKRTSAKLFKLNAHRLGEEKKKTFNDKNVFFYYLVSNSSECKCPAMWPLISLLEYVA